MKPDVMTRRGFLGMAIGGIAAAAAVRTFPFRVFSFPSEIVRPSLIEVPLELQQSLFHGWVGALGDYKVQPEWDVAFLTQHELLKHQTVFTTSRRFPNKE